MTMHDHSADVEWLMPKLLHTDYYTEPTIQELAAKERAEPGFCHRVKDFWLDAVAMDASSFLERHSGA